MRSQPLFGSTLFLALLLHCSTAVPSIAQTPAMDIEKVSIFAYVIRSKGVLDPSPYCLEITAKGSNFSRIEVQAPNRTLPEVKLHFDEWFLKECGYTSLNDMSSDFGFGNFILTFTGEDGSVETATVFYDPGSVDPHPGYGDITFPSDVPQYPTFEWACTDGPCGNFAWYLEVFPTLDIGADFGANLFVPSATKWCPGVLSGNTDYVFWISAGTILEGGFQPLMTDPPGEDKFIYSPGYESINQIEFRTESGQGTNPGTLPPTMLLQRISPTELLLSWSASTCSGSEGYGIYEGVVGDWYSHGILICRGGGADLTEIIPMPEGNAYYLVVPFNEINEGSYGLDSSCEERPVALNGTCQASQALGCP